MKKSTLISCLLTTLFASLASSAYAEPTTFSFATVQQGQSILTTRDDFVQGLSPFDRAARLKTAGEVAEPAYLKFVSENVQEWSGREKELVQATVAQLQARLTELSLPFPKPVVMIKTSGKEEGGAAYTRGNAIILTEAELSEKSKTGLPRLISHELFHVLSRQNPALREKLYAVIGFQPCGELAFPATLKAVKLTNPDAPRNDYCIQVKAGDTSSWAMPILYANAAHYDPVKGGEFFDYLNFKLLLVEKGNAITPAQPRNDDKGPRLLEVREVTGFFEQIGKNTNYIIHPEEIMADNFAMMMVKDPKIASPEIISKMQAVLDGAKQR
ncbi:eCIS core domain-containing protein [Undibacterium terreum]|uniref:eCIS core domain-containing protein n=1 Tax=Undibacterium terreum TaxID=1224302 RepID=A0A916XJB7_9BURK|nr:DUF4157 domain-containing protein [Undibacterium terreum]GGC77487.1 hypothetical protein GCM10011396_25820 [Undibacterium terreum]